MSKRRSRFPQGRPASGPLTTTASPAPAVPAVEPVRVESVRPTAEGSVDELAALDAGWDELPTLS